MNLPYGTELQERDGFLYAGDNQICAATSQTAKEHCAVNDDGQGLRRGVLTYAIAFKRTDNSGFRFTERQRNIITEKYSRFLREDCEFIVFNEDFFRASIEELQQMAKDLNIKVK